MGFSALMLASILAGCCMFWKRAYDDSMPDHVDRYVSGLFFTWYIVYLDRLPGFFPRGGADN